MINRFRLLDRGHTLLHRAGLQNIALGLVTRQDDGTFALLPWPLFANFDSNRLPWFIDALAKRKPIEVSKVMRDPNFVLNGGKEMEIELEGHHEREVWDYMKMRVRLTIEPVDLSRARSFFFFLRKVSALRA